MTKKKLLRIEKENFMRLSSSVTINEVVRFYAGVTDHWGFAIAYNNYDHSFTVEILRWYVGVEIYRGLDDEDLVTE